MTDGPLGRVLARDPRSIPSSTTDFLCDPRLFNYSFYAMEIIAPVRHSDIMVVGVR